MTERRFLLQSLDTNVAASSMERSTHSGNMTVHSGFQPNASANRPCRMQQNARVMPQPGQRRPVRWKIGQNECGASVSGGISASERKTAAQTAARRADMTALFFIEARSLPRRRPGSENEMQI